jgi:hypothetical protein
LQERNQEEERKNKELTQLKDVLQERNQEEEMKKMGNVVLQERNQEEERQNK